MDLHKAFKKAVKAYYDGFDYGSTKGVMGKDFEYDFNTLDALHKEVVKKKKPVEEVLDEEEDMEFDDVE